MYLKKIRIKNIRCFENVEIDFDLQGGENRKWTVLLGENGTGKSTVLKAIALLMAGSDALLEIVKQPNDWIRKNESSGSIEGEIETKNGDLRRISLEFVRDESISKFVARSQNTLEPLNNALEHASRNYPAFSYGAARRLSTGGLSERSYRTENRRARAMASLFDQNADLNPLERWAMRLDYNSNGSELDIVRQVLSDFLPELSFVEIDKKNESLLFNTPDGLISLEHLSDGYQNVAAWVGDLLYQITETFEDYQKPLLVRGLLIIDEVDLHLHPNWQRRLLDFLDKQLPNMQLIVTTHSVVTAQQAPEHALFYCIRRNDEAPQILAFEGDPGKLLLNQLIHTEAFGHVSDESLDLEADKHRYRKLHRKKKKTKQDQEEITEIALRIGSVPEDPAESIILNNRQQILMRKMLDRKDGALE